MSLAGKLVAFGLRQVLNVPADKVVAWVENHLTDRSQTLLRALERANERAWQALAVALAGEGFLERLKVLFASADDRGIREQVAVFLKDNAVTLGRSSAEFRQACLDELCRARAAGVLSGRGLSAVGVARQAAGLWRYAGPGQMLDGAWETVSGIAIDLAPEYPNLARLLQQRTRSSAR